MFFTGHEFQISGKNFLAGIDTELSDDELRVKYSALDLDMVLDAMKAAAAPTGFVILDACRNNPFAGRTRSTASAELATVYAPQRNSGRLLDLLPARLPSMAPVGDGYLFRRCCNTSRHLTWL